MKQRKRRSRKLSLRSNHQRQTVKALFYNIVDVSQDPQQDTTSQSASFNSFIVPFEPCARLSSCFPSPPFAASAFVNFELQVFPLYEKLAISSFPNTYFIFSLYKYS